MVGTRRAVSLWESPDKDEILRGVYTERSECAQNDSAANVLAMTVGVGRIYNPPF